LVSHDHDAVEEPYAVVGLGHPPWTWRRC